MLSLAGVLVLVTACGDGSRGPEPGAAAVTTPSTDRADVTLTGQVARSFGDHVFQLGTGPAEPVLVVLATPSSLAVGARVEVSGRIRTFDPARLGVELGVDLGPDAQHFEGQRCLVAVTVRSL